MKKFLYILTILCLINTPIFAYGIYNSSGSSNCYRSTSLYLAPSRQPIIQTSYSGYQSSNIGYTNQKYSGTYQPFNSNYTDVYTPNSGFNSNYNDAYDIGQPKKAAKASTGSGTYGNVTVTYTVTSDYLGLYYYTIVYTYPDGHTETETYKSWFGSGVEEHAREEAERRAKEYYEEQMTVPIGDISLAPLLLATGLYIFIKRRKRIKLAANFLLYGG